MASTCILVMLLENGLSQKKGGAARWEVVSTLADLHVSCLIVRVRVLLLGGHHGLKRFFRCEKNLPLWGCSHAQFC